ncbi:MAG: PD-(D/E)XK nuclease family transposase, partial [Selenomonadaceae bacterium]|nr:PD-(D/E)XK nuclease family transposase [Selenomonadaceae bacterium]
MEMKRYNSMNDVLFKFIFGKEERKHITIDLINSMLDRDKAHEIVDIAFKNVEMTPLAAEIKLTRLDVFCV